MTTLFLDHKLASISLQTRWKWSKQCCTLAIYVGPYKIPHPKHRYFSWVPYNVYHANWMYWQDDIGSYMFSQ